MTFCQISNFPNKSESVNKLVVWQSCDIIITHLADWFWKIYRRWKHSVAIIKKKQPTKTNKNHKTLQNRWELSQNVTCDKTRCQPIRLRFWGLNCLTSKPGSGWDWCRVLPIKELFDVRGGSHLMRDHLLQRPRSFRWTADKHESWVWQKLNFWSGLLFKGQTQGRLALTMHCTLQWNQLGESDCLSEAKRPPRFGERLRTHGPKKWVSSNLILFNRCGWTSRNISAKLSDQRCSFSTFDW